MKRQALVDSSARNVRPRVVTRGHVRAEERATMAGEDRDALESTESLYNRLRQQRREIGERRLHINEENPLNYYARMIDVPAGSHSIDRRLGTTVGEHFLPSDITDAINAYAVLPLRQYPWEQWDPDRLEKTNIQGFPQGEESLRSPEGDYYGNYGHGQQEPFEGMFWMGVTDSPPRNYLRGPGGRNRTRRPSRARLYNPLEDDDFA